MRRRLLLLLLLGACGGDPGGPADARLIHGCPSLVELQAAPGDPIDGDSWDPYAMDFFATYCTRCHSTLNVGPVERMNAPDGYNWDDPASVLEHIAEIRNAVGVVNFMPFRPPDPTCDERQRIVRWIDAGHPGL